MKIIIEYESLSLYIEHIYLYVLLGVAMTMQIKTSRFQVYVFTRNVLLKKNAIDCSKNDISIWIFKFNFSIKHNKKNQEGYLNFQTTVLKRSLQ